MKQEFSPYFVIYMDLSLRFVTWICLNLNWLLAVAGVMHEADDAYSIQSTWSCYWLDQFLTLALNILILSIFTFQWICLPIILLILVGVELPLRVVVTILECSVTFSGVKLSIRSFVLFLQGDSYSPVGFCITLKFRFAYYYNTVEDIEWVNLATVSSKELIVCL